MIDSYDRLRHRQRNSPAKNRMREICTSGTVGGEGGNILTYPAAHLKHRPPRSRSRDVTRFSRDNGAMHGVYHRVGQRPAPLAYCALRTYSPYHQKIPSALKFVPMASARPASCTHIKKS